MNTSDKNEDFQLWQKYAESAGAEKNQNILDPNIIAAYLDDSATDSEIEMVEKSMADDPSFLQDIIELRSLQTVEPIEISKTTSSNLVNSILSEISGITSIADISQVSKTRYFDWFQTAAGIAAVVLVSFFGYGMGQETMAMDIHTISAVAEDFAEEANEENLEAGMMISPNGNLEEEGLS